MYYTMEVFECTVCKYRTNVKCNFDKHLTENHKKNKTVLKCKYCDKNFLYKSSLQRHENHRCKHNENSKELIKLQLKQSIHGLVRKSKDMERKITSVQNNIDVLMKKYNLS